MSKISFLSLTFDSSFNFVPLTFILCRLHSTYFQFVSILSLKLMLLTYWTKKNAHVNSFIEHVIVNVVCTWQTHHMYLENDKVAPKLFSLSIFSLVHISLSLVAFFSFPHHTHLFDRDAEDARLRNNKVYVVVIIQREKRFGYRRCHHGNKQEQKDSNMGLWVWEGRSLWKHHCFGKSRHLHTQSSL